MTLRAVVIGLLIGLALASVGFLNDWVLGQAYVASDLVPVSVYGLLVLGLLLANPLLTLIRSRRLSAGEWAVITSLMLVATVIPGPGLMWTFSQTLVRPNHFQQTNPGWRRNQLLDYARTPQGKLNPVEDGEAVPADRDPATVLKPADEGDWQHVMVVDPGDEYNTVVSGFSQGLQQTQGELIDVEKVPWWAWTTPLSFWLPLIGLSFVAGIALVRVVHRQWSYNERLRYPVADFAGELMRDAGTGTVAPILRNRKFWLGFAPAMAILLVNGYAVWNPDSIKIPLTVDLKPLAEQWPWLRQMPAWNVILAPTFYFAAVGFAYFVSSEVSFSVGISALAYGFAFLALTNWGGVSMQTDSLTGGIHPWQLFGAYLGAALIIFYVGRRFYIGTFLRALFIPRGERSERGAVWGMRVALLAALAMVLMLTFIVKLDWVLAVGFVVLTGVMFLVVTRINVETGMFLVQPQWHAIGVIGGILGLSALAPNMLVILALLAAVISIDPRVCIMPLAANALRFSDDNGVRPGRLSRWMVVAVLVALVGGVFATLYVQYNFGATQHAWLSMPGEFAFQTLNKNLPETANPARWYQMDWSQLEPNGTFLASAGVGLALVLIISTLRLRFHWWPIHPVLFMIWGTFGSTFYAAGFLLGWVIKGLITRLGGSKTYTSLKPFFVGLVAGEFVAGVFWMIYGVCYYLATGQVGKVFRVHL